MRELIGAKFAIAISNHDENGMAHQSTGRPFVIIVGDSKEDCIAKYEARYGIGAFKRTLSSWSVAEYYTEDTTSVKPSHDWRKLTKEDLEKLGYLVEEEFGRGMRVWYNREPLFHKWLDDWPSIIDICKRHYESKKG